MAGQYAFLEIEAKWQRRWEEADAFQARGEPSRPKYYSVAVFLSPSVRARMGHVRSYAIGDAVSRYKRMRGDHVLHVTGWDAFGLAAAIEHGVRPTLWTSENSARLKKLGICGERTTEMAGCDPERARREQLVFIRMFERGLAYRKTETVNWCAFCELVVADEQVVTGRCSRCESEVIRRPAEGWYLKITAYAEELLESCARLIGWPEPILTMQRNWIGGSEGTEFDLPVAGRPDLAVRVFTRRPETSFGITYAVLAPEHPLVDQLVTDEAEQRAVAAFREEVACASEMERLASDRPKRGFRLRARAVDPFNQAEIPLFLADYVLMEYGTGAVMGAPSEDHRDWEFAKVYGLPTIDVQCPPGWNGETYTGGGVMVNSGFLDGLPAVEARGKAIEWLEARRIGRTTVHYRLRDWGISRQRDGGVPIPIVYCPSCGMVAEKPENLPIVRVPNNEVTREGGSALTDRSPSIDAPCPRCGSPGRRETETMDTFVESSWHFVRSGSPSVEGEIGDPAAIRYWMPVDQYVCGGEHAALHLLYARFSTKVLRDLGLLGVDEPFQNVLTPGGIVAAGATTSACADPDELIATYGADTVRLFSLFAAPPEKTLEWSEQGVEAAARFVSRLWRFVDAHRTELTAAPAGRPEELSPQGRAFRRVIDDSILRVTRDVEDRLHFNTAISAVHELVNALHAFASSPDPRPQHERQRLLREGTETALLLLAPVIPHVVEELWEQLGHARSIFHEPWPTADPAALERDVVPIVVQVDGRVRSQLAVPPDLDKGSLIAQVLAD